MSTYRVADMPVDKILKFNHTVLSKLTGGQRQYV